MQLDLYQEECNRTANQQMAVLAEVKQRIASDATLSLLEQGGTLHALQVLIENAIGKAKHWLKAAELKVPVSAYDSFASLQRMGVFGLEDLNQWNAAIGLRNRIVHDYMNVDIQFVYNLVAQDKHCFIADFLRRPIEIKK
jgi:uncharacterized protein YutE (UPF0331/DUF86 family)